jgi:putative tryptophan/tyrosine transport system substrate-binding protein
MAFDSGGAPAVYVDRIVKGTKPADLPIEQPTKFELVINLEDGQDLGPCHSAICVAAADRVIR